MLIQVEVFSLHAAVSGHNVATVWERVFGKAQQEEYKIPTEFPQILNRLYRLLNRVEREDNERLNNWGYQLPSLSVGDFLTVRMEGNNGTYQVQGLGFKRVTGNADYIMKHYQ